MQIAQSKAILQKALPLFLALALLIGLLPVSPLGTTRIHDAEARVAQPVPAGHTRQAPGADRLTWVHGGQPFRAPAGALRWSGPCRWAPGPWLLPGPPTTWPAEFITSRCIRVVRGSTRRYRIPRDNSGSALMENDLGGGVELRAEVLRGRRIL